MALFFPEMIIVPDNADEVSCDGGGGSLGHPKVWYIIDGAQNAECGYCDRVFVKESAAALLTKKRDKVA
jgi:uncharacterized Zn-finger protein